MYMPPLLEALGLAEVEHNPKKQPDEGALEVPHRNRVHPVMPI